MTTAFNEHDFLADHKGRFVPRQNLSALDLARHETVQELAAKALEAQKALQQVKKDMFDTIAAFAEMSAEEHGVKIGGNKGNITLVSFDGRFKVVRQQQERIVYDETLRAAKALIDEVLIEKAYAADPFVKTLVEGVFDVDKEGRISHAKIAELCRYKLDDSRWNRAIAIIGTARQVADTASFVRVYERDDRGRYQPISLDMAKV